jgi:L-threonylcarbamoyladenylate synthase
VTARRTTDPTEAAIALRAGALVALPTETVYGLGADATNPDAVARIFDVKARPAAHPLIVHLPDADAARAWATDIPTWAADLAEQLWPGPITLIVPKAAGVLDSVTGGQQTVGLRVPDHHLALRAIGEFGGGVAAPSANRHGKVSPTTADDVEADLSADLTAADVILDGGRCPVGVESTIVGAWDDVPRILRAGAVTAERITAITGRKVTTDADGVRAPGRAASHYAPRAHVRAVEPADLGTTLAALNDDGPIGVIALACERVPTELRLADPSDDAQYAHQLYATLRDADRRGLRSVVAVLPPDTGLGRAVRDRLRRAAAGSGGR